MFLFIFINLIVIPLGWGGEPFQEIKESFLKKKRKRRKRCLQAKRNMKPCSKTCMNSQHTCTSGAKKRTPSHSSSRKTRKKTLPIAILTSTRHACSITSTTSGTKLRD